MILIKRKQIWCFIIDSPSFLTFGTQWHKVKMERDMKDSFLQLLKKFFV